MKAPECMETARLILRRPTQGDAEKIFTRYANDSEVTRYLFWARHTSLENTFDFLEFSDSEWESGPAGPYLVESRESGVLLGSTGFTYGTASEAETGYVFARDAWGNGYATEALIALMSLCRRMALQRVYARCHFTHTASQRVLEKCGFAKEPDYLEYSDFPNLEASGPQPTVRYTKTL